MGFVPIFLKSDGRQCVVVGGGEVATRRVQMLLEAGALVRVISPEISPTLEALAEPGTPGSNPTLTLSRRPYAPGDLVGAWLVFAATSGHALNRRLYENAQALNILINVADAPELCTFIVPAILRRGRLQIAVSTGGASPALARRLRQRLEPLMGRELELAVDLLAGARSWLKAHEADPVARARKLQALVDSNLEECLEEHDLEAVRTIVSRCLGNGLDLPALGVRLERLAARIPRAGDPARR